MLTFNELRIDEDKHLIVDVSMIDENLVDVSTVVISDVFIGIGSNTEITNYLDGEHASSFTRLDLDENDHLKGFRLDIILTEDDAKKLIYVKVAVTDEQSVLDCTAIKDIEGYVYDKCLLMNRVFDYIKEKNNPCENVTNLANYIAQIKGLELAVEGGNFNLANKYWKEFCKNWLLSLGIKEENIRLRDHSKEELSFYSNATTDIEFAFPFGWGELWGIADRTDYDLKQHQEHSKQDLAYQDPETNEKFVPYVVEPSVGVDRLTLAFLCNSYELQDLGEGDSRVVLHLHPALAPYKAAVLPLSKKLSDKATELVEKLNKSFPCDYDEAGSIGKRYRREDEIGTPYCITVDFDTLEDNQVTIRDRDTMEQVRIPIDEVESYIKEKLEF